MTPNARNELDSILTQCALGDDSAVRDLVRRYEGMVFGVCYRMLGHRQDAEDAAQETFVRAVRSIANFNRSRRFESWLLTIAANRCRTALAARARRPDPTRLCDTVADDSPDDHAARWLDEELQRALGGLKNEHRQAFVLFHEYEKSYGDIAEIMGCPIGTIKTWVHRARRELIAQFRSRELTRSSGAWT